MGALQALPNIGPELERQLQAAGIETAEQLREIGAAEAWLRILSADPSACLHRLYALEGAVEGIPKKLLPDAVKAECKAFYHRFK